MNEGITEEKLGDGTGGSCDSKEGWELAGGQEDPAMDREAWWAPVRGIAKSRTRLSD